MPEYVIVPFPWCACGVGLGVVPGEVVGTQDDDLIVRVDLSGCPTRPTPPHCETTHTVFTRREIERLQGVL